MNAEHSLLGKRSYLWCYIPSTAPPFLTLSLGLLLFQTAAHVQALTH